MALRFALLKHRPDHGPPSERARSDFEVIFVDLDTHSDLVEFLQRPSMIEFSRDVLRPMRDIAMLVRDRFRNDDPQPRDSPWIRLQLARYLGLIVRSLLLPPFQRRLTPVLRIKSSRRWRGRAFCHTTPRASLPPPLSASRSCCSC